MTAIQPTDRAEAFIELLPADVGHNLRHFTETPEAVAVLTHTTGIGCTCWPEEIPQGPVCLCGDTYGPEDCPVHEEAVPVVVGLDGSVQGLADWARGGDEQTELGLSFELDRDQVVTLLRCPDCDHHLLGTYGGRIEHGPGPMHTFIPAGDRPEIVTTSNPARIDWHVMWEHAMDRARDERQGRQAAERALGRVRGVVRDMRQAGDVECAELVEDALTERDVFEVAIPKGALADELWRRTMLGNIVAAAAQRGYRGRVRFARQQVIGPPGGWIYKVQILAAAGGA
jgi:hypothetical protein